MGYERGKISGKKTRVVNEQGKLLKKAFMWKMNEHVSNQQARERLAKLGLKISHQQISSIFRNPFYCGLISHNLLEGKVLEGIHEKLISREIFLKVNEVQNKNSHGYTTTVENDNIPLKRFLRCEMCGNFLRGYIVKAKGIHYYKCNTKGCNCNKNADSLHKKFLEILFKYTLESISLIPVIKKQMLSTYYKLNIEEASEKTILENKLQEINKKLERQKLRLKNEEIPYDLYLEFLADFENEKKKISDQLAKCTKGVSNPEKCVEFAINYSMKLPSVWSSASYSDKQRFQFLIFPEGLFYNRKEDNCRIDNVNEVFQYIAELKRLLQESKSRTHLKKLESAALVVSPRIELGYQVPETCVLSVVLRDQ